MIDVESEELSPVQDPPLPLSICASAVAQVLNTKSLFISEYACLKASKAINFQLILRIKLKKKRLITSSDPFVMEKMVKTFHFQPPTRFAWQ